MVKISCHLPIHFFTHVLDGQPFIRYHIDILSSLDIPWHWHIIEGSASPPNTNSWPLAKGSKKTQNHYSNGRSLDGTSNYLDTLTRDYPLNITVYRKPIGEVWNDNIEMLHAPLQNISEDCLLWQINSCELWTAEQIITMHSMFLSAPHRYAAFFCSHYFVGPDRVIETRNSCALNPDYESLRVWRFHPGMQWIPDQRATLSVQALDGTPYNVADINPFKHAETEAAGLVFQSLSYTIESQLRFQEEYYGHSNALENWRALQRDTRRHIQVREYLYWITGSTLAEVASDKGIFPLMQPSYAVAKYDKGIQQSTKARTRLAIDGVFFQLNSTGIARLWRSVLECWSKSGAISEVLVLDRDGTMPKIPGARYRTIQRYTPLQDECDGEILQQVLDEEGAELFASTYYTSVPRTKTLQLVYDMIPEALGWTHIQEPHLIEKHNAILKASHIVSISENTKRELYRFLPSIPKSKTTVNYLGVDTDLFAPPKTSDIVNLHNKYGITKPYFLLVGSGGGYKNARMAIDALSMLPSQHGFEVILATRSGVPGELVEAFNRGIVRPVALDDSELCAAYGGAVAFIYPSLYEGFGLPILEAMACSCPVITNSSSSLPEVAGEAVLYARSTVELAAAMCDVQKPNVQSQLIRAGHERVKLFTWENSARRLWSLITALTDGDGIALSTAP
jgi:glycosyltransferase involved in cell wall biosynthesis